MLWRSISSWTSSDCNWVGFVDTREITAVLQTASKNFHAGIPTDICEWIWFKLSVFRYYCTLQFDISQFDLDPESSSQEGKKAKTFAPGISQSC